MAEVQIRRFQEDDTEDVKEIFSLGITEHIPSGVVRLLKQPLTQVLLVCVFCALLASSKSILLPVLAVTLLLAAGQQVVRYMVTDYIQNAFEEDLKNIQQAYLEPPNACFWVAEIEGRVVGTVGCLPSERVENYLELKRMSVKKSHRGEGIAKALCRTVAEFARGRGYQGVVLYTSVVQTDAQKLYDHMGYSLIREMSVPDLLPRICNITFLEYRLDLKQQGN